MRPVRVFLSTAWPHGRRGAVLAASAAVVCLGTVIGASAGGDGGRDGYVAVGGVPRQPGSTAGKPTGAVRMVPLDGDARSSRPPATSAPDTAAAPGTAPGTPGTAHPPGTPDPSAGSGGSGSGDEAGGNPAGDSTGPGTASSGPGSGPGSPSPAPDPTLTRAPAPTGSPAPAALAWGAQTRQPTDKRWCEKVTVPFRNSGGTAVRSGTVTFGTHVIGALGIDWSTVESSVELPAPIGPGARRSATWTVCVDAWRVPLGMHIETRDVSVRWS